MGSQRLSPSFAWPHRHHVVFFGTTGESLLRALIAEDDVKVYVGPKTKLNIWVALLAIFAGWWGIRGYYRSFLYFTRPKFVITFEDNALEFYLTKKYLPNCSTVCIQNGRRDTYSSNPKNDIWGLIRRAVADGSPPDIVLTHGTPWSIYYRSALGAGAKVTAIGSVRNNSICLAPSTEQPRILFVSSFPNLGPNGNLHDLSDRVFGYWQALPVTYRSFFRAEGHVAAAAATIARNLDLEFCVLGKRPRWQTGEFRFFESALKQYSWQYLPSERDSSSYESVRPNDIIVNIDSTFGYEMFARGLRVASISCRMNSAGLSDVRDCQFAYPLVTDSQGHFWTNSDSLDEIRRVILNVASMSVDAWGALTRDLRNSVMTFDPGNLKLCKELGQLGINTFRPKALMADTNSLIPDQ